MSRRKINPLHPKWSYAANIYEVNVRQYTPEGTFKAFAKHLPRLRDMGVRVLWFMPITPISEKNKLGNLGSYYSVKNYKETNPEFGTINQFKNLVKQAHDLGFKVIIDFIADHTGNDHEWTNTNPEFYVHDKNGIVHPQGWNDVSQLNYENPDVWKNMVNVLKFWIRECDIDGYRCDMAHLVPLEFWIYAKKKISRFKENLFWLAECENPEYHQVFDATYTWRWMHASEDFYHGKINLQNLLLILYQSVIEFPCNAFRVYFTSNHDENSWNGTEYEKYGAAANLMAVFSSTWNGIPMIYSGQELPNKKRLKFFDKDEIEWNGEFGLHSFYKILFTLRSNNKALRAGDSSTFIKIISHPKDQQIFSYLRAFDADQVLVVLNFSDQGQNFEIQNVDGIFRNVFGGEDINFETNRKVYLNPWGYLVFEKMRMLI